MSIPAKSIKLDIACGNNKQKGFIGIDISPDSKADIIQDLNTYPWPIEDNSVEQAFCSHYLEHIPHGNGYEDPFWDFFDELYRILKPKGTVTFITPYYASARAFQDPTHMRFITEPTYFYLSRKWRKANKLDHYPIKANFDVLKLDHSIDPNVIQGRSQEAVQQLAMQNWNIINDLVVTIKKM